jgi:hypothetical protein
MDLMAMPEIVEDAQLPDEPLDPTAAADSNHQKLAKLRAKALDVLGETMDVPTPAVDDDDYARVLSIKKDAAVNVVTASLKADENCFRQRRNDTLDRLFVNMTRLLEARRAKEAPTIDNMVPQGNP